MVVVQPRNGACELPAPVELPTHLNCRAIELSSGLHCGPSDLQGQIRFAETHQVAEDCRVVTVGTPAVSFQLR